MDKITQGKIEAFAILLENLMKAQEKNTIHDGSDKTPSYKQAKMLSESFDSLFNEEITKDR